MARIRTVKPEFFRHEGLQELEAQHPGSYCMLVFEGLWCHSDREGRFEWKPKTLKLDILPFLNFDIASTLDLLEKHQQIASYQVDGKKYGYIPTFSVHQHVNVKEPQSKIPAPVTSVPEQCQHGADTVQECGELEREKELGTGKEDSPSARSRSPLPATAIKNGNGSKPAWQQRQSAIEGVVKLYPLQIGRKEAIAACDEAITRLEMGEFESQRMSAPDAMEFMRRKVSAFARSPEGQSSRAPNAANFFAKSRYLDPEESWYLREQRSEIELLPASEKRRMVRNATAAGAVGPYVVKPEPTWPLPAGLVHDSGTALWSAIQQDLGKQINRGSFDTWIKPIKAAGILDRVLYVKLPTAEFGYVSTKWADVIAAVLEGLGNPIDRIEFVAPVEEKQAAGAKA